MMPMLNRSRATKKGGRKMRWDAEGPDAVFLFGQEFCGELEGLTKAEKYESDARYLQYNKQGFYKRIDEAVAQVLSFPTGFPSEHFRTKCLHYIDETQGPGAAQRAVSGAAAAALSGKSARVAVNKHTTAAQLKTAAATPRRGSRKKAVIFNLSPPPLEEADADDDYDSEEDIDYEFDAELDDITLNTEGLSLTSKESAIDSIRRHGKISDNFEKEDSSEEESDDQISCLSIPRVESQAKEDSMGFRVQYSHLVEYPNNIVYIIVYFIGGCNPSFFVSNKDEKSVWMVESTPSFVYDAIEVYKQQGLTENSGHVMLLQAEMNKKNRQQKKKWQIMTLIWEALHRGRLKMLTACTSSLTRSKAFFIIFPESTSRIRFMGTKAATAQTTLSFSSRRRCCCLLLCVRGLHQL
jgi:hypothetical protein